MSTFSPEVILQLFKSVVNNPKSRNGIQWRSDCPFHDENTLGDSPFHFNVNENGVYQCKSCGAEGNIYQFAKHHNINLSEYGYSSGDFADEAAKYHNNMLPGSKHFLPCWEKDVIEELKVGWNAKLKCYVFPIFKSNGVIVAIKHHKVKQTVGAKATLYPLNLALSYDDSFVVICEGERDAIALICNGIPALTSTGGAKSIPKNISLLRRFKRLYICLDNDNSGRIGTDRWIVRLHQLDPALHVRVCDLSGYVEGDVTDYFLTERKNYDKFISEILEKSYYAHRPFTDIPVFTKEVLTSEIYLSLKPKDQVVFSTIVTRASRYYITTAKIRGMRFHVEPGQYIRSRRLLAEDCGKHITEPMVRRSMAKFEKLGLIRTEDLGGKRGMRITLIGWADEYGQSKPQSKDGKTVKENFPYFPTKKTHQLTDNDQSDS